MTTTTVALIDSLNTSRDEGMAWLTDRLDETELGKKYGEVGVVFTICDGQITDLRQIFEERKHFPMKRKID